MKVALRKVTKTPLDFRVVSDTITFKGSLEYHSGKLILLKATLSGLLEKSCDSCAEEFTMPLNEKIEFFISDGMYEEENDTLLDVVESFDGVIDIDEILNSEIELIKSDYHSCQNCKNKI